MNASHFRHFTGMVARADERAAGDHAKAETSHLFANFVELFRRDIAFDGKMFGGRLQVLTKGQHLDADISQVGTDVEQLFARLAQTEHQARRRRTQDNGDAPGAKESPS